MTDTLGKLIRTAFIAAMALLGMLMAAVFVVSTAIAVGVLYLVAKLRGKPFLAGTYWRNRAGTGWGFNRAQGGPQAQAATATPSPASPNGHGLSRPSRADIIDVEARDIR